MDRTALFARLAAMNGTSVITRLAPFHIIAFARLAMLYGTAPAAAPLHCRSGFLAAAVLDRTPVTGRLAALN